MKRLFCLAFVAFVGCGEIPHMQFTPAAKAPEVAAVPSGMDRIEQQLESIESKLDEPVKVSAADPEPPKPPVEESELPTLTLPEVVTGKPGAFIKVSATTNGREVRWQALDDGLNVFPGEMLKDSKSTVVTGEAGEHRLMAYTALADVPSDPAVCIVRITGPPKPEPKPDPRPEPRPEPQPDPKPTPVVTTTTLWLVSIDDQLARGAGSILTDVGFWNQIRASGHQFAAVDKNNPAAAMYSSKITQAGMSVPCMVIMDAATKDVLGVEKIPTDRVAVAALISRYTGK